MNISKQKTGYISATLTQDTIKNLTKWSKINIPENQLFTMEINGEIEGGDVTSKAHLTLFFGLNDSILDKDALSKYISTIIINKLEVEKIDTFPTPQPGCKILILRIKDAEKQLLTLNNELSKFPNFIEHRKHLFNPHITIAFVKDNFDINKISIDGLPELMIQEISYCVKNGN